MLISHPDHLSVFSAAVHLAIAQCGGSRMDWNSEKGREQLEQCYEAAFHLFTTKSPSALGAEVVASASGTITDAYRSISAPTALDIDSPFHQEKTLDDLVAGLNDEGIDPTPAEPKDYQFQQGNGPTLNPGSRVVHRRK